MTKENKATTNLPLFYKKVVPLNNQEHSQLYIEAVQDYHHTKETNSVYISSIEFIPASHEYAIVFARDANGNVFPSVLLGIENDKNLLVDQKGQWMVNYIPAYVRRYPFILATAPNDKTQFTVCIDENFHGFNTAKEGQPLFDKAGNYGEALKQTIDFLKEYQAYIEHTTLFCNNLLKLDLLEPMEANIETMLGKKHKLSGFMLVNRAKLKALSEETVSELFQSDQLELIYAHLSSLSNMRALVERLKG